MLKNGLPMVTQQIRDFANAGFSLREMIKNHARRLQWFRGYSLPGKDRKIIEDIFERAHFETLSGEVTNAKIDQGYALLVFGRTINGDIQLRMPLLWGSSNVAKHFETEELAVTWERVTFDHQNYIMRIIYRRNSTVINFFQDSNNELGEAVVLGEATKIARGLNMRLTDNHNWGIVSVLFMKNLPHKNFLGDVLMEAYPDDTPSGDKLEALQQQVEDVMEAIDWELKFNITFIIANLTSNAQKIFEKDANFLRQRWGRFIITNSGFGVNSLPGGKDASNPFTVVQGQPKLETYANYLNFTIDRAFNICGYNSPQGTREHGTNKTSSEISVNMQNDMLTTAEKIRIETAQYNRLIKKIGIASGKPDIDCRIEIHGMSTTESIRLNEETILRFQHGLISRAEAIAKLDRIPIDVAEERAKKIEAEEKAKAKWEQAENKPDSNTADSSKKVKTNG